jgi:hypothetical protein
MENNNILESWEEWGERSTIAWTDGMEKRM